jgi:hypothetical protein
MTQYDHEAAVAIFIRTKVSRAVPPPVSSRLKACLMLPIKPPLAGR